MREAISWMSNPPPPPLGINPQRSSSVGQSRKHDFRHWERGKIAATKADRSLSLFRFGQRRCNEVLSLHAEKGKGIRVWRGTEMTYAEDKTPVPKVLCRPGPCEFRKRSLIQLKQFFPLWAFFYSSLAILIASLHVTSPYCWKNHCSHVRPAATTDWRKHAFIERASWIPAVKIAAIQGAKNRWPDFSDDILSKSSIILLGQNIVRNFVEVL